MPSRDKPLTRRQLEVLDAIDAYQQEHGYMPSFRELAEKLGLSSTNGVNDHLKALERKGWIQRDRDVSRAIRITRRIDTSPHGLLARASSLAEDWPGPAQLDVAEDESWWRLVLQAKDQECERVQARLEPDFSRLCWIQSNRHGVHVYAWGVDEPGDMGFMRTGPTLQQAANGS